jgi:hypothetical protein
MQIQSSLDIPSPEASRSLRPGDTQCSFVKPDALAV